ncbi:hypothetical protein V6N13_097053 [Hibiscus sabdariffa]
MDPCFWKILKFWKGMGCQFRMVFSQCRRMDIPISEEMMVNEGLQEKPQSSTMPSFKDMLIGDKGQAQGAKVFGATHTVGFFEKPFESWLQDNLSSAASLQRSGMDWGMRFSIWCCLLWKLRCCMVFDAEFSEREGVLDRGYMLIAECERIFGFPGSD